MTENELFVESKDNFRVDKKFESLKLEDFENLDYQYETPYWEKKFVKMIERMRTVPYVSLGHFQFINVNWMDENLDENLPIVKKVVVEEDKTPINHWELVKKLIFSNEKVIRGKSIKDKSNVGEYSLTSFNKDQTGQNSLKYSKPIIYQFNNVFNYFRDFVQNRKLNRKKKDETIDDEQSIEESDKKIKKSKRSIYKRPKNLFKNKLKLNKLFNRRRLSESNKCTENPKLRTLFDLSERNSSIKNSSDQKQTLRRTLGKRKDFLLDLTEMSKKKRFNNLNVMMSKDDGPFLTDYRFLLGIDFWTNYCGVEKYQLISVCSSNFWLKEMTSFTSGKLKVSKKGKLKKIEKSKLNQKISSKLKEIKKFLEGTNKPAKAPQRVISSEEKFRYCIDNEILFDVKC